MKSWMKKAAGIIFTDGKSLLLLKRAGEEKKNVGKWEFPGGKSKEGETEIGNAIRETKEETGLDTIPGHRFDSVSTRNGQQKFTTFFYRVSKPFEVKINHEHSASEWIDFDHLKEMDLHPKVREHLPDYLHKIRKKITVFSEWTQLTEVINQLKN